MTLQQRFSQFVLFVFLLTLFGVESQGEPWLSNRFASNCAACHSPGRVNRKPRDRRCTLSCQGCHVNPNGGGLRNQYGMWNSQRFLRSFHSKVTWNRPLPAPFKYQRYAKKKIPKKVIKRYAVNGAKLVERKGVDYKESEYRDYTNYRKTAKNIVQDLMFISSGDPYRLERTRSIYATGDFRFFLLKLDGDNLTPKQKEPIYWPMAFDLGVRLRPFRQHRFSFVYESRIFNGTRGGSLDYLFGSGSGTGTRSAYLIYDDLPYNSYVQYGFYRPLFGVYNPNHANLFAEFTGLNQNAVFKSFGFGMAPNVPFFIFNLLTKSENPNASDDEGFVVTGGLRGVTLGWSLVGSYWSTRKTEKGNESRRLMVNLNAGMQFQRLTTNLDYTFVETSALASETQNGSIITLETKYRLWREFYAQLNYTTANAAILSPILGGPGLTAGSASELAVGFKTFLVAGSELEILFQSRKNREEFLGDSAFNFMSLQWHLYF